MTARLLSPPALWIGGTLLLLLGLWRLDASPLRLLEGLGKLGWLLVLMVPPSSGGALPELLEALLATVAMAFLGTVLAAIVSFPLAFLGAANVMPLRLLRLGLRRLWDGLRGIDTLIWALVFVAAVGLGPFAGVLAIAVPDIGASVPERLLAGLIPREHGMVSLVSLESLLAMSDDIAAMAEPTPTLS